MKTIGRLRELVAQVKDGLKELTAKGMAEWSNADGAVYNALPALLAVMEAQQREIAAWRESYEDGTVRLRGSNYGYSTATDEADFVPVQDAMSRTDEALRKLDEVTP